MIAQLPATIGTAQIIIGLRDPHPVPALVAVAGEHASLRFLEFFAANIRNPHTRRRITERPRNSWPGARAPVCPRSEPCSWCTSRPGLRGRRASSPRLRSSDGSLRHLFDWLVDGQVVPVNPAHTVRGPRHVVTSGQTPVLDPSEARPLLVSRAVLSSSARSLAAPPAKCRPRVSHGQKMYGRRR
jgi:hypothetical protein